MIDGDVLVCLVGESGSGKTTVAKYLHDKGYNVIQSYTTRPPREENEWGHKFIDHLAFLKEGASPGWDNCIAYKELYGYFYWATYQQYQGKGISIYVIDPEGAKQVKENVKDAEVIIIYLAVGEDVRLERLSLRSPHGLYSKKFGEAYDRIMQDREMFKVVPCDVVVNGERITRTIAEDILGVVE